MQDSPLIHSAGPERRQRGCARLAFSALALAACALLSGEAFGEAPLPAPSEVQASAVYVLDADTGRVLYQKNEAKSFRLLSLTKLITAYILVERYADALPDKVAITQSDLTNGSTAGLRKGDVWTVQDLLTGMLLVSGNDAALAIADHLGHAMLAKEKKHGNAIKRFVQEMRPTAAALGAAHSQFADPDGLSPTDVSTARDIATIARTVFRDERLLPYWQCTERTLEIGGPNAREVPLKSTIEILGAPGIVAAKTGSYVSKNLYHLAVGWKAPNGDTIVAVVLGAPTHPARYDDMRVILDALPRDFPELGKPSAAAAAAPQHQGADCR